MRRKFVVGAVDTVALLARQLDLPARLERDSGAIALERENMPVLVFGLEAVVSGHPQQQVLDPARAGVGDSGTVGSADDDLFVLGADPPLRTRLAAILEVADQVVLLFKQLTHASIPLRLFLPPLTVRRALHNLARCSSPLPVRERIEGEGPYIARSFARDSRFCSCPESFRRGFCKILLKRGCDKRAYNGLSNHARQAHLYSSYTRQFSDPCAFGITRNYIY